MDLPQQQSPHNQIASSTIQVKGGELSAFKSLKELPDDQARVVYKEEFEIYWKRIEERIDEVDKTMEAMATTCNNEYYLLASYDRIYGLLNKTKIGLEIKDDHEDKKILFGHRLVIEATLIEAMNHALDVVEKLCANGVSKQTESQEMDLQLESLHLTDEFFQANECFLKSYLEMPW